MKISLNWLKDYIEINESPEKICELLTDTGLEVEGLEAFEQVKGGLKGLVIGEVVTCEKHPNADKLSVTTVDIGGGTISPIVCGAPNVAAGQKVVVATVGATLYPSGHEPFKIKKAKIRGETSEGMICAEDEIGLGTSHDGIMVLETVLDNGTPASEYFDLEDDHIIEIGLTPNRADATSHIGVARDVKAVTKRDVKWPELSGFSVDNSSRNIKVTVENQEACPRYSGITISGVTVQESPEWLKIKLKALGLEPINNIVDTTNFVLHEMGQPLHAFDADEIADDHIIVKTLAEGTKFTTLDDKERSLNANDLMICDGKSKGLCIAGVFGGVGSGVKASTKNIFIESAYFSADYVRKTAMRHQLKTDASFRYERGTDPNLTITALKRAAMLIKEIAGGSISSEIVDIYPESIANFLVEVKYKNIDRLIGKKIDRNRIVEILNLLDIEVSNDTDEKFTASVPPYRVDVQREADVIEEILRIYGFNNVELPEFVRSDYLAQFPSKDRDKTQKRITEVLAANGYFEIITNSLTKPGYAEKAPNLDEKESVVILNKLSEDLGVMRQSMLYTGLEVAAYNANRRQTDLKLFEFGKAYFLQEGKYIENKRLAIYLTGNVEEENWIQKAKKVTFHDLAAVVDMVLDRFINQRLTKEPVHQCPFDYGVKISVNNKTLATLGRVKEAIARDIGLKQEIFYADVDWDLLLKLTTNNIVYQEVPKFPEVRRDLSLVVDKAVTFEQIKDIALKSERKLLRAMNVFDVYEGDKIGADQKAYAVNFILQDNDKTLNDKVIDKTMNRMMASFENELGALIRK